MPEETRLDELEPLLIPGQPMPPEISDRIIQSIDAGYIQQVMERGRSGLVDRFKNIVDAEVES
jgi:hypothetical protein